MTDTLLCFAAILLLSAFFADRRGVRAGAAPLLSLCAAMVYFSLAGVLNLLAAAGWLFYAACLALGAAALWRSRAALLRRLCCPGFVLFCAAGLVMMAVFALRRPMFGEWDEFVLWGIAPKIVKQTGELYTVADMGWLWTATERPGLILLGWLAQFFGGGFAAWKVYWAIDLLMIACAAALAAPFGFRQWRAAVPLAAAGLLVPFFFGAVNGTVRLSTVYLSAYADIPGGVLFGGVLAVYFGARGGRFALWPAALCAAALALVKENLFPLALLAAAVIAADRVIFGAPRTALRRAGGAAAIFAAVLAPYIVWQRHIAWALQQRQGATVGATNVTPLSAAGRALAELLGAAERSPRVGGALEGMWNAFLGNGPQGGEEARGVLKSSMAGSGLATFVFILCIFALAALAARTARAGGRAVLAGALLLLGFAAYQFMLLVYYAYMNHAGDTQAIVDYTRYMASYYSGWMTAGLALLGRGAFGFGGGRLRRQRLARAGLAVLALGMLLRFGQLVRPGYSVLDFTAADYARQRQSERDAERLGDFLPAGARVFFVDQSGGDGGAWFETSYYLLPAVLEYSITGGGAFTAESLGGEGAPASDAAALELIAAELSQSGCGYILVRQADGWFSRVCAPLFEGQPPREGDAPALYGRTAEGRYAFVTAAGGEA